MGKIFHRLGAIIALAATMVIGAVALAQQAYLAPRGADGKPDLNGIWQALNEANYDLEAHVARPAMALRPGTRVKIDADSRHCWGGFARSRRRNLSPTLTVDAGPSFR